jgi:DNA replication and repair protein RecF
MAIVDLRLQHFRSYDDSSFSLSPSVNIVVGPNASGKTNLLEAVLLVARGSSYRVKDAELVQFGSLWARIDAHDDSSNTHDADSARVVKIELNAVKTYEPEISVKSTAKKSFELEGKKFIRMSRQKSLPVVLFEPNHLLLLSGSPELRRSYLDDLLEQTVPGFGAARRQYRRVLAQRNALLKQMALNTMSIDSQKSQMFVWNVRLGELAGKIVRERLSLIEQINQMAGEVYSEISHTSATVTLEYVSTLHFSNHYQQYESALLHKFEQNLERDCMIGFTTAGPHRDDLRVLLNGHASQETASRGEVRTIILTLKILELQLLQDAFSSRGQSPLLLLDDVFSELDTSRRQALTAFLHNYQTFITTTDADVVLKRFRDSAQIVQLQK